MPLGNANRVVVGENEIQHRARPLAHAFVCLLIVGDGQQQIGVGDAREGGEGHLRRRLSGCDAAQQGDVGDTLERLETDLWVVAPPRDLGERPLVRQTDQGGAAHTRVKGADGDRHPMARSGQARQRACAVLRRLVRDRAFDE